MNAETDTRSPDEIENEIRRTQHQMSDTVDRLGEQMTPRNLLNGLLDKAEENGIDARYLVDGARRNPLALGMIAIGGIWLVSDSDARPSSLKPDGLSGSDANQDWDDDHHQRYVTHMSSIEPGVEEDRDAYRYRRDCARANFLMIEQGHDEEESSFRQRLDEATNRMREQRDSMADRMRERRDNMSEGMHSASDSARRNAKAAASKAKSTYQQNPLLGGLAAAFVGAIAGSAVPVSRTEKEKIGQMGSQALDTAKDKARHKKDEMVDKADQKMSQSGSSGGQGASTRQTYT